MRGRTALASLLPDLQPDAVQRKAVAAGSVDYNELMLKGPQSAVPAMADA